jgi:hypothetical protein
MMKNWPHGVASSVSKLRQGQRSRKEVHLMSIALFLKFSKIIAFLKVATLDVIRKNLRSLL